jgi:hypothetical protein
MFELFENELNNLGAILDQVKNDSLDFLEKIGARPTGLLTLPNRMLAALIWRAREQAHWGVLLFSGRIMKS